MRNSIGIRSKTAIAIATVTVVIVIAAACAAATTLRMDADWMQASIPNSPDYTDSLRAASLFPEESLIVVALPSGQPFSIHAVERLKSLVATIDEIGVDAGKVSSETSRFWTSYSPLSIKAPESEEGQLRFTYLLGKDRYDPDAFQRRILNSPLYKRLFLSPDGSDWQFYIAVRKGVNGESLLSAINRARQEFPELRFSGKPYYKALNERTMMRQFLPLLAGSALILLLVQVLMVRSFAVSSLLWFLTLSPTLLLLGLMVVLGSTLRFHMILAPIVTLALSTSYTTHIYRGWGACEHDLRRTVMTRGSIILLDAATTVFGYASLIVSPLKELREIGIYSIAGAAFSVITSLISLPAFLTFIRDLPEVPDRYKAKACDERAIPFRSKRSGQAVLALWAIAMIASIFFSLRLDVGKSIYDQFVPGSALQKEAEYFRKSKFGIEEVAFVVDTGQEYGLINPELFGALRHLENSLSVKGKTGVPYGYTDLVAEVTAILRDVPGTVEPSSEAQIGEGLELLSGIEGGLFSRGFVNGDWSAAKYRLPVTVDFRPSRDMKSLRAATKVWSERIGIAAKILWSGLITNMELSENAFIKGQISGAFIFLVFLAAILFALFRSLPKALAVMGVSVAGLISSLGFIAFMGWKFSDVNALAIATVAGTGVDSAIIMVLHGYTNETRNASFDTSVLIVAALSVLVFCSSFIVVQTALICLIGLVVSAVTAQLILPVFLKLNVGEEDGQ